VSADRSAERVALNDATFRNANERIDEKAEELDIDVAPFLCECADESCTALIRMSLSDYEEIRSEPTHFLNVRGHQVTAGPHAAVVAERDGYLIVRKLGVAAQIVTELDERGADERSANRGERSGAEERSRER
jgi:hypothetical protein